MASALVVETIQGQMKAFKEDGHVERLPTMTRSFPGRPIGYFPGILVANRGVHGSPAVTKAVGEWASACQESISLTTTLMAARVGAAQFI